MDHPTITPAERERLTHYLTATRERLWQLTRGLSAEQLDYKPAPDRWSAAENIEHLTIVGNIVLDRLTKAVEGSADPAARSAWEGRDEAVVQEVESRLKRFQAPEFAWPTGRWSHDELFGQFEAVGQRTSDFAASTVAALRSHLFPHPVFGELDCFQWLLLMGAHCVRHSAQIQELLATSDFPQPVSADAGANTPATFTTILNLLDNQRTYRPI